jgi:hypothetical protein
MTEFFAMFTTAGNSPKLSAHLEVAIDNLVAPIGTDVLFTVYDAEGSQLAEFTALTNANGFASSASAAGANSNLFTVTGNQPGLVRARTPVGAIASTAALQQRQAGARLIVGVPPTVKSDGSLLGAGTTFPLVIGDVDSATLLVGNVSGTDVVADVYVGTKGAEGAGKYTNPRIKNHGQWKVQLQASDLQSTLILAATGNVVAQLIVDDGRAYALTCLPT